MLDQQFQAPATPTPILDVSPAAKQRRVKRQLAQSNAQGLRATERKLIRLIGANEEPDRPFVQDQAVLARKLGIARESVSRLVGRMVARNAITTRRPVLPNGHFGKLEYRLTESWEEWQLDSKRHMETSHGDVTSNVTAVSSSRASSPSGGRLERLEEEVTSDAACAAPTTALPDVALTAPRDVLRDDAASLPWVVDARIEERRAIIGSLRHSHADRLRAVDELVGLRHRRAALRAS